MISIINDQGGRGKQENGGLENRSDGAWGNGVME